MTLTAVLLSILAATAIALVFGGVKGFRQLASASSWANVEGTVTASKIVDPRIEGDLYRPVLAYTYKLNGQTYTSSTLGITDDSFDVPDRLFAEQFLARFPLGSIIRLRVAPDDHSSAVFEEICNARKRNHYQTMIAAGAILLACAVLILVES